jgi:hypothetical protein
MTGKDPVVLSCVLLPPKSPTAQMVTGKYIKDRVASFVTVVTISRTIRIHILQ